MSDTTDPTTPASDPAVISIDDQLAPNTAESVQDDSTFSQADVVAEQQSLGDVADGESASHEADDADAAPPSGGFVNNDGVVVDPPDEVEAEIFETTTDAESIIAGAVPGPVEPQSPGVGAPVLPDIGHSLESQVQVYQRRDGQQLKLNKVTMSTGDRQRAIDAFNAELDADEAKAAEAAEADAEPVDEEVTFDND